VVLKAFICLKTLPPPETIVHNLILALPKLVEGMLVSSEFYDRRGAPDSYFEGRVAEVLSILSVRQFQAPSESTIDEKISLDYEVIFEAESRYFSWDFSLGGRLPARSEWQWEDDEDNSYFFRVILRAEIFFRNHEIALLKTISAANIEQLDERSSSLDNADYVGGLMDRIEKPQDIAPGDETLFLHRS
jgi:hypothetical protein